MNFKGNQAFKKFCRIPFFSGKVAQTTAEYNFLGSFIHRYQSHPTPP